MGVYTVAEAKENLSDLINRAHNGEVMVITDDGAPVAELQVVRQSPGQITVAELAWLDARRVTPQAPLAEDAASLGSRMRGEGGKRGFMPNSPSFHQRPQDVDEGIEHLSQPRSLCVCIAKVSVST